MTALNEEVDIIWGDLRALMGREPPDDGGDLRPCRGGDDRLDISLVEIKNNGEVWRFEKGNVMTGPSSTYKGHKVTAENRIWRSEINEEDRDPYRNEWVALLDAIRNDKPHNEVKRGVDASVVCNMGRMATHTGREVSFEEALNHVHEYAPNVAQLTADGPAPLMPDADGRYPKPQPGQIVNREYAETAV